MIEEFQQDKDISLQEKTDFYQLPSFVISKSFFTEKVESKEEKKLKFLVKKRGRKNKSKGIKKPENKNEHNKFSNDNVKRKIKAFFNRYIIKLLNNLVKGKYKKSRIKFLKMNIKITKDISIGYNRNLLNTPLKEIIVNVSNKYKNKENNNKNCIKFIEGQKDNEEIINILNMTYEQLYINYLNTTKNDSQENSFEAHKEKMLKVYGKEYLDKFIENTKNFIEYFKKGKNRKSRKPPEVDIINIPLEFNKNNIIEDNKIEKIMVESFAQTDLCGINSKLIAFY